MHSPHMQHACEIYIKPTPFSFVPVITSHHSPTEFTHGLPSALTRRWCITQCEPGVFSQRCVLALRLGRVYGEEPMGNNSQGSHPPLKTAQQAPHQQSFEEEMNGERAVCVCWGLGGGQLEEPHLQIINIVFQSNPNTRRDLRPGYEKKAGRLSVPKFFFLFFSSAKLST